MKITSPGGEEKKNRTILGEEKDCTIFRGRKLKPASFQLGEKKDCTILGINTCLVDSVLLGFS